LIDNLNKTCDEIEGHVFAAKQESTPVLDEACTLLARKEESEAKQHLLDTFCKHFLVSDADLTTLTSTAEPVNERFFTVLARVKQIHKDCEILLGYENQRLGLELMEQTTRNLDAGFKKLYAWIQREFKGLDLEDPHISGSIRRALRILSERPTLFQNCLDFFAQARESTLSEAFQAALTGSGSAHAIEFSTHDPLRYVGDMLAWVHAAAVSEKEALEGLFISDADEISKGLTAGRSSEPWARFRRASTTTGVEEDAEDDTVFDGRKALNDLVGRNLQSVCQTLNNRVELVTKNNDDPVLIYKIYNLLTFYRDIFAKLLGSETSISRVINQLETTTLTHFERSAKEETTAATADTTPTPDLTPPPFLHTALRQLSEITRARGPQMTDSELERLFSSLLSGILDACAEGAMQLPDTRDGHVYKINYFTALRAALRSITMTIPHVRLPLEKINQELQSLKDRMIESITTSLLEESGVNTVLQETDMRKDAESRRTWLLENLEEAAQKLDDFLASGLMDAQDSQRKLVDKNLAKEMVSEAVERFYAEFDELESMVQLAEAAMPQDESDENIEDAAVTLRDLYPRTGAEVRALLS
jgi:conserved oligomeric Golgi complex subunit 6